MSGVYARRIFKIGQKVKYDDAEGEIVEIGTINSKMKTKKSFFSVPNQVLIEHIIKFDEQLNKSKICK